MRGTEPTGLRTPRRSASLIAATTPATDALRSASLLDATTRVRPAAD